MANSQPPTSEPRLSGRFDNAIMSLISFLLASFGGFVTLIFALFLLCTLISRISGGHAARVGGGAFILWLILGALPLGLRRLLWVQKNETFSLRKASRTLKVVAVMTLLFLIVGADAAIGPKNWHKLF